MLPFHAFGTVVLNYGYGLADVFGTSIVVSMWKETILVVLTVLFGVKCVVEKKLPQLDRIDNLIFAYIAFGLFHALWLRVDLSQLIWGARYDYMFLWVFFIVRHFGFTKDQVKKLFLSVIYGGGLSVIVGYILHYIVKPENFTMFGFRNDWSTWYEGQSLAFCQRIENQELCRMSGTFAGPNQFGAYLVMLIPILVYFRNKIILPLKNVKKDWISWLMVVGAFFGVYNTYSRGAMIGILVVTLLIVAYRENLWRHLKYKHMMYVFTGVLILGSMAILFASEQLVRPESTSEHLVAWTMGLQEMFTHPLGQGLGSAGPASYRTGTPIIPESWYLQVGIELGFIGLALFLGILTSILKKLHALTQKQDSYKSIALISGFLGVLTVSLFLHTLEDSAVSVTLFALIGAVLTQK